MIETLIRTSALFALVGIAAFVVRRSSATLRHTLWSFAIVGAVLLPVLSKVAPFQWRVLPAASVSPSAVSRSKAPKADQVDDEASTPGAARSNVDGDEQGAGAPAESAAPSLLARLPFSPATGLLALWAVGALILLARLVVGLVTVNRIAERATEVTDDAWRNLTDRAIRALDVRVPVEVRRSDEVAMPFATGLVRPIIVLPANTDTWNPQQREAVLLHELAHISRGDLAMNVLSHVMRAAYWVNPLAWLAAHRLRVEGEKACDDAVIRGGARPSEYADHLLSIVRTVGNTVPNVALAMARRSDFEGRLLAILEPGVPRGRLTRVRSFALAVLFIAAVMPLAAMTPIGGAMPKPQDIETALNEMPSSQQPNNAPLPEASSTIAALAASLDDETVSVRLAAVNSLGNLQDPAAIAALAKALKEDTDARVREAAAWALGEIDDNRAVPHLLESLKAEKATKVREKIVQALNQIDDPSATNGVIAVLRDPAPEVRRAAASALAEFEDPAGLKALLGMTRDEDVQVRREIAQHIGQLETSEALQALIGMATDADDEVRASAIEQFHHFENDAQVIAPLVRALKDKSPHVRQHAAEGLGNRNEQLKSAPGALIDALQDPNRDVRRSAASALGNIGDEAAVPALKRLVSDNDTETRRHAVEALKEIGGADAITALMGLLKDSDPEVRKTAAEALGKRRGG
jgi:HEAT repeat protein/beta-lactamase regulating signal transducer with metallopeptidase domain